MSNIAIKAENLSKAYQLGEIGTGTISRDIERWVAKVRGKEDPFLKVGETNDRTQTGGSDVVWSLKDINFEIEQGSAVGIIGRNGAGKSTLLKVLSRVTSPTTGKISGKGRIASLLEVGTGFHPDLTGRENIFLNGAILGMRRKEIQRKFDEIVEFAGVARYVDTPVKRYSSGMYVRLAFAVAAHLDSEILIVDEVLAVGDAEFQKKCLGKMGEVSRGEGRTVLFVSHNMGSVSMLCNRGILLKNGGIQTLGNIDEVIAAYSSDKNSSKSKTIKVDHEGKKAWLKDFKIVETGTHSEDITTFMDCSIIINVASEYNDLNALVGFAINDGNDVRLFTLFSKFYNKTYSLMKGDNIIKCDIPNLPLKPGAYNIEVYIGDEFERFDYYDRGLYIDVMHPLESKNTLPDVTQGHLFIDHVWK
jgi:lipopolysaccharide transport system ATP-binding protein